MTERPEPPIPTTGIPSTWTEDQWRLYGWEYFAKHPDRHPLWASQINDSEVKEVEEPLLNETSEAEELAGDDLVELSRSLESQKEIEEETDDPLLDLAKSLKESKPAPPPERDPTTSIPITKPPRPPGLPPSARNQQPITSVTKPPRPEGLPPNISSRNPSQPIVRPPGLRSDPLHSQSISPSPLVSKTNIGPNPLQRAVAGVSSRASSLSVNSEGEEWGIVEVIVLILYIVCFGSLLIALGGEFFTGGEGSLWPYITGAVSAVLLRLIIWLRPSDETAPQPHMAAGNLPISNQSPQSPNRPSISRPPGLTSSNNVPELNLNASPQYSRMDEGPIGRETLLAVNHYLNCSTIGSITEKNAVLLPGEKAELIDSKAWGKSRSHSTRPTKVDIYMTRYRLIIVERKTVITYPTMISIWMNLGRSFTPFDSLKWSLSQRRSFITFQKEIRICQANKELIMSFDNEMNTMNNRGKWLRDSWKFTTKKYFIVIFKCKNLHRLLESSRFDPIEVGLLAQHFNQVEDGHRNDVRIAHGTTTL